MAMEKKKIFVLLLIIVIIIGILITSTTKNEEERAKEVEKFEKFYLPKKIKECLGKHGYSLENPSDEEKKECEDYVKQIWEEQRVLNNIEE
jgi:hypothetical protein